MKISLAEHKRICKREGTLVAHVVGEEDLFVEDIDGELDLMELGPLNPVLEYPRSLQPYFKVARSLRRRSFCNKC